MIVANWSWLKAVYLRPGNWAPHMWGPGFFEYLCEWSWVQAGRSWEFVLFPQLLGHELFSWSSQSCKATHSTPGYIIFLACSIILEMLVIKDKNSWGFFKHKNYKKSGPFFDPLPFRLHAAFYSHLDILVITIILVFFLILLFFKDCSLMKCFLKNNWKKVIQNVLYIQLNDFLCLFY